MAPRHPCDSCPFQTDPGRDAQLTHLQHHSACAPLTSRSHYPGPEPDGQGLPGHNLLLPSLSILSSPPRPHLIMCANPRGGRGASRQAVCSGTLRGWLGGRGSNLWDEGHDRGRKGGKRSWAHPSSALRPWQAGAQRGWGGGPGGSAGGGSLGSSTALTCCTSLLSPSSAKKPLNHTGSEWPGSWQHVHVVLTPLPRLTEMVALL